MSRVELALLAVVKVDLLHQSGAVGYFLRASRLIWYRVAVGSVRPDVA
jgi:hypothetical protein